jgi:hypothetical protein
MQGQEKDREREEKIAKVDLNTSIEHIPQSDCQIEWRGQCEQSCEPFNGIKRSNKTTAKRSRGRDQRDEPFF